MNFTSDSLAVRIEVRYLTPDKRRSLAISLDIGPQIIDLSQLACWQAGCSITWNQKLKKVDFKRKMSKESWLKKDVRRGKTGRRRRQFSSNGGKRKPFSLRGEGRSLSMIFNNVQWFSKIHWLSIIGSLRKEVDLPDVMSRFSLDVIWRTSLNFKLKRDAQHRNPKGHLVETLMMNLSRQDRRKTEALEKTLLDLTGEVDNYKWAFQSKQLY